MSAAKKPCMGMDCPIHCACAFAERHGACPQCFSREVGTFEEGAEFYRTHPTAPITDLHCRTCGACWNNP